MGGFCHVTSLLVPVICANWALEKRRASLPDFLPPKILQIKLVVHHHPSPDRRIIATRLGNLFVIRPEREGEVNNHDGDSSVHRLRGRHGRQRGTTALLIVRARTYSGTSHQFLRTCNARKSFFFSLLKKGSTVEIVNLTSAKGQQLNGRIGWHSLWWSLPRLAEASDGRDGEAQHTATEPRSVR